MDGNYDERNSEPMLLNKTYNVFYFQRELRERMLSKIMLLREERDLLMEEKSENDQKGKKIAQKLEMVAKSTELDKFRLFLEEIEQITKLTVSLTIRLSRLTKRIENGNLNKEEKVSYQQTADTCKHIAEKVNK